MCMMKHPFSTGFLTALLACNAVIAQQAPKPLEIMALVDHYDFAGIKNPADKTKFLFDTETAEGCEKILDHVVQQTKPTTILWRPCSGSVMRYQSKEESFPKTVAPIDKRRSIQNESEIHGWVRYNEAEPDIIRHMLAVVKSRGLRPGVHWPFEETHWMGWTFGAWNLEHPQYWGVTSDGMPWSGRTSLAYPEVVAHKLRILDELLDRNVETVFIDTWRSGGWSPAYEFVAPELKRWEATFHTPPPKNATDPQWCAFISETTYAFFKQMRSKLDARANKIRLLLGVSLAADRPNYDELLITRGIDWKRFVNEGLIDGLVVMAVNWKRQDPFGSTLTKYREIMDFCQGKCQVFFAVQGYNFTHKGVQEYVEATKLPAREVAQKLLDITREVQADGVVLECVDYRNYAFFPAVP